MPYPPIVLVQPPGRVDHFVGVPEALEEIGHASVRQNPGEPWLIEALTPRVVVVKDTQSLMAIDALRRARRVGATSVLLMDGVLEYRNTFENPFVEEGFLRPAPVDRVMCAGALDEDLLRSWGNRAVATGLPRVHHAFGAGLGEATHGAVMVATANRPAFTESERARLIEALARVRDALGARAIDVRWRLTDGLEVDLGVENDGRPLEVVMRECRAVLSTPSTLVIEAMEADRFVGIVHPQPGPLWQRALWTWRGGCEGASRGDELERFLDGVLMAGVASRAEQRVVLETQHCPHATATPAERVARFLAGVQDEGARRDEGNARVVLPTIARFPRRVARERERTRVVSCVGCDGSPVGGVMTWSLRLARSFAQRAMGYDVRTLAVVIDPSGWNTGGFDINPDGLTEVVVLDPLMNATERLATMIDALERLEPEIVLPNYADVCYMATMALQARGGVRSVAIAHSDEPYYRDLASMYAGWNAAVGVSASCAAWLRPIADSMGKPYRTIVYGVPVDDALGRACRDGSRGRLLRIAYIGRMVEVQKRIGDLLTLVDGLEALGVRYEMHMVGDGRDLASWKAALAPRTLRTGSVRVHGRRDPVWVERFLPTMDFSVLVSDFEGTSITMLEAMGRGVVPAVTRVSSGVDEWVRDGENGVVVPIGEPRTMAARLAELWRDREGGGGKIEAMGRAAWETVRKELDLEAVAQRYREVFDLAMASPPNAMTRDLALRPLELTRWTGSSAGDGVAGDHAARRVLRACGYERIVSATEAAKVGAGDGEAREHDAVLVEAHETAPPDEAIERWRAEGLGVAISPGLVVCAHERRMGAAIERLVREGMTRIALYGTGLHTRRLHRLFRRERWRVFPVVGFMDDRPSEGWPFLFGLPVVHPDRAIEMLQPHAIVLSSDTYEAQMWDRCEPFRARGLRVVRLHGVSDECGNAGGGGEARGAGHARETSRGGPKGEPGALVRTSEGN